MNIIEILLYTLSFSVFYFVIGKAFNRVNDILEKKLNSKVYDAGLIIVFILVVIFTIYTVVTRWK